MDVNWLHGASVTASQRAGLVDWLVEVIVKKYNVFLNHIATTWIYSHVCFSGVELPEPL